MKCAALFALLVATAAGAAAGGCVPMKTKYAAVCVCNSTYCDAVEPLGELTTGQAALYQTAYSKGGGDRLSRKADASWSDQPAAATFNISLSYSTGFQQRIIGFGGAFTDAATLDLAKMQPQVVTAVLDSYYAEHGLRYSTGRVPMAGTDFSTHDYTYDESAGDFALSNFSIAYDLSIGRVALIKRVVANAVRPLRLFASAWTAPSWMKTNDNPVQGQLKGQAGGSYHSSWALYYAKFLTAYASHGLKFWAVTTQNEPTQKVRWQSMQWTAQQQRDWVAKDLGPLLRKEHPSVAIMMLDDQRNLLPTWADTVLGNGSAAADYVNGTAVHWYASIMDNVPYFNNVRQTVAAYPDKFVLATEACTGFLPTDQGPKLGSWSRGEAYGHDILGDLNVGVTGWTDWNIALDMAGGPNHVGNNVDSPILLDTSTGAVAYKQPMYYYMGHFARWFAPGSTVLNVLVTHNHVLLPPMLEATAVIQPDGQTVALVVMNRSDDERSFSLHDPKLGKYLNARIPAHAIQTWLWKV